MTLDEIWEEINKANSIILLTHENPDGDAVGSSLAFYNALKNIGKNPDLVIQKCPRTFGFLPCADEIKESVENTNYDLAISLDSATIGRLNGFSKYFENAKMRINIDHHVSNMMFGDLNYVDPASPACAQILVMMFEYFKIEITKDIGMCLLTGIITDTGGFKYPGVSAETFSFVSSILEKGVNVSKIYRKVLEIRTKSNFELSKLAYNRLEFLEDGKVTFTYINMQDVEKINGEPGDHEGIVEIGRSIEGVEVAIFIRETEHGYKVSLRSNEYVNVSDIAMTFSGGGHPRAAGCIVQGSIEQVKNKLLSQIRSYLYPNEKK